MDCGRSSGPLLGSLKLSKKLGEKRGKSRFLGLTRFQADAAKQKLQGTGAERAQARAHLAYCNARKEKLRCNTKLVGGRPLLTKSLV